MTTVLPLRTGARRMRVLTSLSSVSPMGGDVQRLVFETCARLSDRFAFELAIDDHITPNVDAAVEFGKTHEIPVRVGSAKLGSNGLDIQNEDLPRLLKERRWDVIETHSPSCGATSLDVLANLGDRPLAFSPYFPPTRVGEKTSRRAEVAEESLSRMIRRADVVFCASPWEARTLQSTFAPDRDNCVFTPLGCDFEVFRPGPRTREPQLVVLGSALQPGNPFHRVLDLYQRLVRHHTGLRLVIVGYGNESSTPRIPDRLKSRILILGAQTDHQLAALFANSLALIHLSDDDASGTVVARSLACGTPAVLSRTAAMKSLFGTYKGAHFASADDPGATLSIAERILRQQPLTIDRTLADRSRLESDFAWDSIAEARATQLRAAWFRRKYWAISA